MKRDLDAIDGLIEAEIQNQVMEQYEKQPRQGTAADGAIPTGLDDDIRGAMKKRKPN